MNFLSATESAAGELAIGGADGKPVLAGIRPEHLSLCGKGTGLFNAKVNIVEQLGSESFIYLEAEKTDEKIVVKVTGQSCPKVNDWVGLKATRDSIYLFDPVTDACIKSPDELSGMVM